MGGWWFFLEACEMSVGPQRLNDGRAYVDVIKFAAGGPTTVTLLDMYSNSYAHKSRTEWQHVIESGAVTVNDTQVTDCQCLVQNSDRLVYFRPPWLEPEAPSRLDVLHQDDHVVAIHKPSGLPVMPSESFWNFTVVAVLKSMFPEQPPTPCHRLGVGTSGVLLCARSQIARQSLSMQFQNKTIQKTYRAVATGTPLQNKFSVSVPIGCVPYPPPLGEIFAACPATTSLSEISISSATPPKPKPSLSHCTVLCSRQNGDSLVEVQIVTGRPHQIRIHLAYAGHPLRGDPLYGVGGVPLNTLTVLQEDGTGLRVALPRDCGYDLHAMRAVFDHPVSKERVKVIAWPISADFLTEEEILSGRMLGENF
eukprot:c18289_g1_i1.p1 GENE.c18289_g1_i1~~c18289_g1_i1.p1  ORF type:complete len:365 (-),score=50.13 c18289_g1_i1:146-1240(-)